MRTLMWCLPLLGIAMSLAACGGEAYTIPASGGMIHTPGTGGGAYPLANWTTSKYGIVTAGLKQQSPMSQDSFNGHLNSAHVGSPAITSGYEFTTPANQPFAFSVIAREEGNTGAVQAKVAHTTSALGTTAGAESIFEAGMLLEAPALFYNGNWWQSDGDGAVAMTVRGSIAATQVLIFETTTSQGSEFIAVRIKLGNYSDINMGAGGANQGNVVSRQTIFSNDGQGFGLPAIAVSGDRYSVTSYDGDANTQRDRVWLQLDAQSGNVTGGTTTSASPDSGNWRDQEIAALNNVLAVVYTGNNQVQVEISLDRGASFGTPVVLNEYAGNPTGGQRLVQVELAADYTLAVAYWRGLQVGSNYTSQLCVAEATPTGFDTNFTPTGYSFGTPWVVHTENQTVVPVVLDLEYSTAGDLVVGYGFNAFLNETMYIDFRCATRLATGPVTDYLIERFWTMWGCDPSVSIIGTGASMRIFYAYELPTGIRMVELRNLGATPIVSSNAATVGAAGCYMPSVHARMQGSELRVDLLYLAPDGYGWSLRRMHWDDWDGQSAFVTDDLFTSTSQAGGTPMFGTPGLLVQTAGFMGYDAVTNGDDVAIALHTLTNDLYSGMAWGAPVGAPPPQSPPQFFGSPGTPTLLPGMGNPVPTPDPNHRNQLEIIVID